MTLEDKRTQLHEMLQMAVILEFSTIPPYLTAAFSIFPEANRESFSLIHSVYMEEMLHLVLAANVMNATGGSVSLGKDDIPSYPLTLDFQGKRFKNREFEVDLARFSKESVYTFMKIELPDYWPTPEPTLKAVPEMDIPGDTIGDFYKKIQALLKDMCEQAGEKGVFIGDPTHQIPEQYYWGGGGKPIEVTDLETALEAIDVIIEQGEGGGPDDMFDGDKATFGQQKEVAHFFKFSEIYWEQKYTDDDDLLKPPTGEKMPVDFDASYKIKANCTSSDFAAGTELSSLNTQFNVHFTQMLKGIEFALNGNPKALYPAIMNDMHGMAKIAYEMVQIAIPGNADKEHGAPSFEWVDLT